MDGCEELLDDWVTPARLIRDGEQEGTCDKETWRLNEKVEEIIERRRLARKKWDSEKTKDSRQEYKEM